MKRYHDLIVWQKAHQLVMDIYRITENFPAEEKGGLTSQLRRTVILIPASIVEGYGSSDFKDFVHATIAANNALSRLAYLLELARELSYLSHDQLVLLSEYLEITSQLLEGVHIRSNKEPGHEYTAHR